MESTTCIMATVHLIWALQRMRLWTCMAGKSQWRCHAPPLPWSWYFLSAGWVAMEMKSLDRLADLPVICYAGLLDSRVWRGCYPGQRDVVLGFRLPNRVTELRWASCKLIAVSCILFSLG
ncbi:unnamed protein product [Ambrosiozyma monospora]|uniref:Unnamed protein product n=1 Tax=Ambrosiozyma monospora TaxID=43982 RepID=A0A9W6T7K6_AMBMO|nr:unnamed protein product [Ambrosiozyma monospora]